MTQKTQGPPPTGEAYAEFEYAFGFFNAELFDGRLPSPLFTFQRKKNAHGYLSHDRFVHKVHGNRVCELAMNPTYFAIETLEETMQTLVHEMVHLDQLLNGNPGRRRYHNKEWASMMEAVGLMPSSTGRPGGKRTGENMSDYVIPGGRFQLACKSLLSSQFRISWLDRYPARARVANSPHLVLTPGEDTEPDEDEGDDPHPTAEDLADLGIETPGEGKKKYQKKYECKSHTIKLWGKPGINVVCGECHKRLEES